LVGAGLPIPLVNHEVFDAGGLFVGRPDMVFGGRVIVEYEGDHHRTERSQWHRDIRRAADLEDLGYRIVRATAADRVDAASVAARVRRSLADNWAVRGTLQPRSPQVNG
jgi:hypothetical protein